METLILFGFLIIGILIRFLLKRRSARKANKPFDLKLSVDSALLSLLTGAVMILARDDMKALFPITRISIVFIGYTGDSFFRNLMKQFKKK